MVIKMTDKFLEFSLKICITVCDTTRQLKKATKTLWNADQPTQNGFPII